MLKVISDTSSEVFLREAGPLLYQDEAFNSLMLGLVAERNDARLFRILESEKTVAAAIQFPSHNLILTAATSEELKKLAALIKNLGLKLPGVIGLHDTAEVFAKLWNSSYRLAFEQKIYQATEISIPKIDGEFDKAQVLDVDLIAKWLREFVLEAVPHEVKSFSEYIKLAEAVVASGYAYFWKIDGQCVAMAHVGRPTRNGISVKYVFTPVHLRGKGYASAVTAHLSQAMLNAGKKFCVLYTNAANSASNKIYQNIGYQLVGHSKYFIFDSQP